MAAFEAAIAGGLGIECDARASADGIAILFHDVALERMAGREGRLNDHRAVAIDAMTLPDGGAIPRLAALLERCGGTTPLLIEIKAQGRAVGQVCRAVAADLATAPQARAAVMSFNPLVLRWFARAMPDAVRGLVVTQQGREQPARRIVGAAKRTLALWLAKPDFLACDIRDLPTRLSARARRRGMPVLTWTVRSAADRARAAAHADQIIFEGAP